MPPANEASSSNSRLSVATEPSQGTNVSRSNKQHTPRVTAGTASEQPAGTDAKKEGLFSALKDVLPILIVYSYFAGWIYAYAFFRSFRVPVASLDIPLQYFFMYSFSALASWQGALLILVAAILVIWLKQRKLAMVMVACLLLLIVFAIALVQGRTDAALQRHNKTNDRILLSFTEDALKAIPT